MQWEASFRNMRFDCSTLTALDPSFQHLKKMQHSGLKKLYFFLQNFFWYIYIENMYEVL